MNYQIIHNNLLNDHSIYHDVINQNNKAPHEQIFINYLYKIEIKKNYNIAKLFMIFAFQFFPKYKWTKFDIKNSLESVILECGINDYRFKTNTKIQQALSFGEIATEFLIRYLNYSLIKCQNEPIILTAQNNCNKLFIDYLYKGYSIQKLSKIKYININEEIGYFEFLPTYPTKECGFKIDEMIETKNHIHKKIID